MAITVSSIKKASTGAIINQLLMNNDNMANTLMISKIKDYALSNTRLLIELQKRLIENI